MRSMVYMYIQGVPPVGPWPWALWLGSTRTRSSLLLFSWSKGRLLIHPPLFFRWQKREWESEREWETHPLPNGFSSFVYYSSRPSFPPVFVDDIFTLTAMQLGALIIFFCLYLVRMLCMSDRWTDHGPSIKSCTSFFIPKRKNARKSLACIQISWTMSTLDFDIIFFFLLSSYSLSSFSLSHYTLLDIVNSHSSFLVVLPLPLFHACKVIRPSSWLFKKQCSQIRSRLTMPGW